MSSGKTIARNAGVMMVSQLLTWSLGFIVTIFLPRYLGPSSLGELAIADSIWIILSVLISFGMDTHLVKMVAREPERSEEILGTSLTIRIVFGMIAALGVGLYTWQMHYSAQTIALLYIVGTAYLIGTPYGAIVDVLTGMERMDIVSLLGVVNKAIMTILTIVLILLNASLYQIAAVGAISTTVGLFLSYHFLSRHHKLRLRLNFADAWEMLNVSKQYLLTSIVLIAYHQIDKLFIVSLVDTRNVGWYETALKLFSTLMFVPVVIGTVTFPALSRTHMHDKSKLIELARRGIDLMFVMGVPVGLGLMVISKPLVLLLYGPEFEQAGPILSLLGFVLIFTYLNTFLGQLLISTDRTAPWNVIMILGVVITAPLDFALIPWTHQTFGNGALGGALSYLMVEAVMVIGAVWLLPKHILAWSNIRTAVLSLLCGLLMVAACWWWRDNYMIVSIIVGAVVYSGAVLLLRVVPQSDLLLLRDAALTVVAKFRPGTRSEAQADTAK